MDSVLGLSENFTTFEPIRPEARTQEHYVRLLGWNVPQADLYIIPAHWLNQAAPPISLHYLIGTLYSTVMVFGLFGNGLVIWIFTSSKSLRTSSNVFIINLAVCDFLMMSKIPILVYNSFKEGMALGPFWCEYYGLVGSLSGIGAAITNAFIAYDRYNVITNPLRGRLSMTKAIFLVIFIWCYTMPWTLFPYLKVWGRYVPEGFLSTCSFDYFNNSFDNRFFVTILFTFAYIIPMTLIIFYYSKICRHVFSHEKTLKEQAKIMNVNSLRSNQKPNRSITAEIRIAKATIICCFLFVLAWTPYSVIALVGIFGNQTLLTPIITMLPAVACKLVACFDPYVYAISHPKYRIELQKRLPWLAINEKEVNMSDTTSMITMETISSAMPPLSSHS